jgi:hypothetical protein
MSEWAVYWQAFGTLMAAIFGVVGLYKIYHELKRLREQRDKDHADRDISAKLKRTEFFLNQHRRLFDNPELYSVLCLIDSDSEKLLPEEMWDKKRKFLTFIEEMALLVESKQIDKDVACYMFGYYARCAKEGENFSHGINMSKEYWGLFYIFCEYANEYSEKHTNGPPSLSL